MDHAADKILALHQAQDKQGADEVLEPKRQARIDALRKEAARTWEFLVTASKRLNRKGQELKTNVTDAESAKMATGKGVIEGYAAQAAVDSAHQVIIAADVIGSGSEQAMLRSMIEQASAWRAPDTLVKADSMHCKCRTAAMPRSIRSCPTCSKKSPEKLTCATASPKAMPNSKALIAAGNSF